MSKKVDNANLGAKLALRRHFLRTYHAAAPARVFDCCQATCAIWRVLRREFPGVEYWGVDLVEKSGRLKIDSARVLDQPGWTQNIIDIDTYGSPWTHWFALLRHCDHDVTVFLTLGFARSGRGQKLSATLQRQLGLRFRDRKIPETLRGAVAVRAGIEWPLAFARTSGFRVVECVEAKTSARPAGLVGAYHPARYIGVRLEKI